MLGFVCGVAMCGCLHYVLAPCHVASYLCTNVSEEVLSPFDSEKSLRAVDHPPPSSAEVNERVVLYLYSSSGP